MIKKIIKDIYTSEKVSEKMMAKMVKEVIGENFWNSEASYKETGKKGVNPKGFKIEIMVSEVN